MNLNRTMLFTVGHILYLVLLLLPGMAGAQEPGAASDSEIPGVRAAVGQVRNGFAFDLSFLLRPGTAGSTASSGVSTTNPVAGAVAGGLALGYKIDRVLITIGLDYGVVTSSNGGSSTTTSSSAVTILPGIQVAFWRSADRRAEVFGRFQLGGGVIPSSAGSSSGNPSLLVFDLAPGARYWAHPHIAIQATAGFGGEVIFVPSSASTASNGIYGLSASLGALAVL